jgi:hypothetical protein
MPKKPDADPSLWDHCPDCGGKAYSVAFSLTSRWSMHQVCETNGCIRPEADLHFTARKEPTTDA